MVNLNKLFCLVSKKKKSKDKTREVIVETGAEEDNITQEVNNNNAEQGNGSQRGAKMVTVEREDYDKKRKQTTTLRFSNENLTGIFDLNSFSKFVNLEKLFFSNNKLTDLVANNQTTELNSFLFPKISFFNCYDNYLTNLDFLSQLNPDKLEGLSVGDNDFPTSDLAVFSRFTNLKLLEINYNRFTGSLEPSCL